MQLNFSINFNDLHSLDGLDKVDQAFLYYLKTDNKNLYDKLITYRSYNDKITYNKTEYSNFLIDLAKYLDDFIAELFFIEQENLALKRKQREFDIVYECRRKFVQRIFKNRTITNSDELDFVNISKKLIEIIGTITEKNFAINVMNWLNDPEKFQTELKLAENYALYMVFINNSLPLFNIPRPINNNNLIRNHKISMLKKDIKIGFDYRDNEITNENGVSNAKYCIYCHNMQKDSCRYGNTKSITKKQPSACSTATGCPLDQKISEMNQLLAMGFNIGALGVIIIDNPLVVVTGHRICNDCMKSCIFQKQDPVNIPLIESVILDNVLNFPYGAEIYILLTKWNPLNILNPLPKKSTNYNILVVGLGPAGFAIAYYLLQEGHNVVAIDGLKIQDLDFDISKPIKDYNKIKVPLSTRSSNGFGGVAEYGITNRWDKNNLILARLLLVRRANHVKIMGGARLGSNITTQQAFELGFDHISLCLGAGAPKYIAKDSYFLKGVKSAADFLMNLQQGSSYLAESNSNLLLRMPVVVIGGGLTAIDSAVEAIHYYPTVAEKFLISYEKNLINLDKLSDEEKIIAKELINHAKLFRDAKSALEKLDIIEQLGGVTICYRKQIEDSPAYKRNHEEIEHAKSIGVKFATNLSPMDAIADDYNYIKQIQFHDQNNNVITLDAKTVLVAIGTEENGFIDIPFWKKDMRVTHFGDCNQKYSGSVVKALASAKNGYKQITKQLIKHSPSVNYDFLEFSRIFDNLLKSKIHDIKEIKHDIIEITIYSPLAAKNYSAGQVFRLQNFAKFTNMTIKPLALSPCNVDVASGLISFVILKTGNSTKLCANLKIGEEVVLMGPTGLKTNIPKSKTVILIGQGIRIMALLPIAEKIKEQGTNITFIASYKKSTERFYSEKIEKIADKIIWSAEDELPIHNRAGDVSLVGNMIDAIKFTNSISDVADIILYTDNSTLEVLKTQMKLLFADSKITCSLLSPMQCMMKGICGQCIQKIDSSGGYIFACACSWYNLKNFEPKIITDRLAQNSILERIEKI